ncbi:transporter substrate-binding domain-containing protein [Frigidibacter sp. RF13]|uniref:LysM peptidoglycan-binding domain-containing protein n=1 Tax=Frigidibacter sp. RF13 TaxID=2997340 RepID=UPI00226E05F9|nr:transporter substrate-binding domain-containing protein [Frigidibacter sp. RF13]MCY1128178.1 transporter substrate-binding domain-containing protein [Frigidibacter sp. RF13]
MIAKTFQGSCRSLLILAAWGALASHAFAQEACSTYVVKEGDTLGSISMSAFGRLDYQAIFNANTEALRANPNALSAGMELAIPCGDGRRTAADAVAEIDASASKVGSVSSDTQGKYRAKVRFVTGGDWYPFADEGLSGGGFLIRLVSTAMQRAGNDQQFSIEWVDDWDSHLTTLLPLGAFDASVAWYQPDCASLDTVSEMTRDLCLNYDFSESLYDAVFGFFTKKGNAYENAKTFADLKGARICRPEGYSFHDLDAQGLMEPVVTISVPDYMDACVKGIMSGEYDIFSVESQAAYPALKAEGAEADIVENPRISSIQAIAVMTYKSNPNSRQYLTYLNRGLNEMRDSGEWYDIISSSLQEANEKLASQ